MRDANDPTIGQIGDCNRSVKLVEFCPTKGADFKELSKSRSSKVKMSIQFARRPTWVAENETLKFVNIIAEIFEKDRVGVHLRLCR